MTENTWTFIDATYAQTGTVNNCTFTMEVLSKPWYELEISKLESQITHYRSVIERARRLLLWGL